MSTAEIEHTVISHPKVSDAASIAIPDDLTGEAIVIFFVAESGLETDLKSIVANYVSEKIGKIARPKLVFQLSDLPKTRTGKIMRRLLKSKLLGGDLGDLSSLENPDILDEIPSLC
jgi:acetyl-CoA synthetase